MKLQVTTIPKFDKQAKALSKRYPSLKNDLMELGNMLVKNPEAGTFLFGDVYKIRMAVKSKGRGKSGGARVMSLRKGQIETRSCYCPFTTKPTRIA